MKKNPIIIGIGVVLLGTVIGLGYMLWQKSETIDFLTEQYALEKEELADEYTQLAIQYEGYRLEVNNDSLEQKLEDQRIKIQKLVEELKQTKAETYTVEGYNCRIRHYLARFKRKGLCYSKSEEMIVNSLNLLFLKLNNQLSIEI